MIERYAIGVDISTQTISAMLIGVREVSGVPAELILSREWTASRPCGDDTGRRTPRLWVELVRQCIDDLREKAKEAELVESIGVSTAFPGAFPILQDGTINPRFVSLYDNTYDAGLSDCSDDMIGRAEKDIINRIAPGNAAIGLAHLINDCGLRLEDVRMVAHPNTAFAYELLNAAGVDVATKDLISDFTQPAISGLYNIRTLEPVPESVAEMLRSLVLGIDIERLRGLLPQLTHSWRNIIPVSAVGTMRTLLGLPELRAVSIGAGDSPLGALALMRGCDTIINVRGSTDSPILLIDSPRSHTALRENILHYPLPSAKSIEDSPWCAVAPMLRSGKVWDWVKNLGGGIDDSRLEALALEALKRRMRAAEGSMESKPLVFDIALGGERAPDWNPHSTGVISGLLASHSIGDVALAALEGVSCRLKQCIDIMEERYNVSPPNMLLAGGCARNSLWNWVTQTYIGKKTYATSFSDASLLGAALLGYASAYDGVECDNAVSGRLLKLSDLSAASPMLQPVEVSIPEGI